MTNTEQSLLLFKPAQSSLRNTSALFFACHPDDAPSYFEDITNSLLEKTAENSVRAVFSYLNPAVTDVDFEELCPLLDNLQLIVVCVTERLLMTPNLIRDRLVPYALEKHIPLLPLLQDISLTDGYASLFGNLQFLCPNDTDPTALPYDMKVSRFLNDILVGDTLRERVQDAFEATLFLSYRKKDRVIAQDIMRRIHQDDRFRDVAIWYDEFLVPGEDFNRTIREAIEDCDVFAMAVTPHILETDNYVMTQEYPTAVTLQKTVLPLEGLATDRDALCSCYKDIPQCTDVYDGDVLSASLRYHLHLHEPHERNDSPEHDYLIGLAYLTGIDVETNHERGIALIRKAAEAELPEAISQLITVYRQGIGCEVDYSACLYWLKRLTALYEAQYPTYDPDGWLKLLRAHHDTMSLLIAANDALHAESAAEATIKLTNAFPDGDVTFDMLYTRMLAHLLLYEAEVQRTVHANPECLLSDPDLLRSSFEAALVHLRALESLLQTYAPRLSVEESARLSRAVYTPLLQHYFNTKDFENVKRCCDKWKDEALGDLSIAEEMAAMLQAVAPDDPAAVDVILHIFDRANSTAKNITKGNAALYFTVFLKIVATADLLRPYLGSDSRFVQACQQLVDNGLACYSLLSETQKNNQALGTLRMILVLEKGLAEDSRDKERHYTLCKSIADLDDTVCRRLQTVQNKRAAQLSHHHVCLLALLNGRFDDAFRYGSQSHNLALELANAADATLDDKITFVDSLSMISDYYRMTNDVESAMHYSYGGTVYAARTLKAFPNVIEALGCFAKAQREYGELLINREESDKAFEHIRSSVSAYHAVAHHADAASYENREHFMEEYGDTLMLYGDLFRDMEREHEALTAYRLALEVFSCMDLPDRADAARLHLACTYYLLGDDENAADAFCDLLDRLPSEPIEKEQRFMQCVCHYYLAAISKGYDPAALRNAMEQLDELRAESPDDHRFECYRDKIAELLKAYDL